MATELEYMQLGTSATLTHGTPYLALQAALHSAKAHDIAVWPPLVAANDADYRIVGVAA